MQDLQTDSCLSHSCQCLSKVPHSTISSISLAVSLMTVYDKLLIVIEDLSNYYIRKRNQFQYFIADLSVCKFAYCQCFCIDLNILSLACQHVEEETNPCPLTTNAQIYSSEQTSLDLSHNKPSNSSYLLIDRQLWQQYSSICSICHSDMSFRKSFSEGLFEQSIFFLSKLSKNQKDF